MGEEHDNWNGGIEYYVLDLKVPVATFASVDAKRDAIEKLRYRRCALLPASLPRCMIRRVRIIPETRTTGRNARDLSPDVICRIWERDSFHLFITHRAQEKLAAAELKMKLSPYGVCGFVAHQDIEPNQVWQTEIERALISMHALVALITPGFDSSVWCQQEIGFALGRGVPVIPLRLGSDPHGFIARIQAVTADLTNPTLMAGTLVDTLIKDGRMSAMMRERLVREIESVKTWENARLLRPKLVSITDFDIAQLTRIEKAS